MTIPDSLLYTKDHEWVRLEGDTATVGITDYAQNALGDVTFVDLPKPGERFATGKVFGVVESVKAASDLFMPLSGQVISINEQLKAAPELVNRDCYQEAWMIRVRIDSPAEVASLLAPEAYRKISG